LCRMTATTTSRPTDSTVSALPPTTIITTAVMPTTDTSGRAGSSRSTNDGTTVRRIKPTTTGTTTICTIDTNRSPASTGRNSSASSSTSSGVSSGASSVDTVVIATDSAVSPRERYTMTFEAVPPGAAPTSTMPVASSGDRSSARARPYPASGITTY